MNCDCVKRIETNLASSPFIVAKAGSDIKVECQATGFAMTDDMGLLSTINIPFRIRGTGKGFTSAKGKEMPCVASHCPFCGRTTGRYVVGEDAGIAAAMHAAGAA
ncbi:hypothetical protein ACQ4WP_26805 [Janthinobacterium sp. GB4P2]|uniref:hypothetical protein n=1 Tax=Janthinobacterium sp. GB4P2 TaxID=3424189 RepID=UPI003F25E7DA